MSEAKANPKANPKASPKANHDVIQTLRTAHQNQTQLNLMADQKANILIGTLVLMFTVVLTRLLVLSEATPALLLPMAVFVLMELVPLTLTTLVLIPKNIGGIKKPDIKAMPNPLFFGYFTQHSEAAYRAHLHGLLADNDSARDLLIKDIYQIGLILRRKYRLLRMAYITALLGVVVPVVIWVVTAWPLVQV